MSATPDTDLVTRVLLDAFSRVAETVPQVLEGLSSEDILWQPDPESNSIGWLVWHLSRVQDDHLAGIAEANGHPQQQVWGQWREQFALPYPSEAIGYGQSAAEVARFDVGDPELLIGYHRAVDDLTTRVLGALTPHDYDRVVDDSWTPPVTTATRLVSVVNDTTQHVGQAAYLHGLRRRS